MARKRKQSSDNAGNKRAPKRARRRNPLGLSTLGLVTVLAVVGVGGGYGLYRLNKYRKGRRMLPSGPEGPTQGESGSFLGWEWQVDANRIMVRPADGDWVVIDQAGAKSRSEIEDLVSEYLRTVVWSEITVMPPAIRLTNEIAALSMPPGWDAAMAADATGYSANSSAENVATAELTSWKEQDGSSSWRVVVTPMGNGTAIVTVVSPGQAEIKQARVVVT